MIFHASIPAADPKNVAEVIAQLWGGFAAPFPAFPDSWMAIAGDDRGTIIETYPSNRVIIPGEKGASFVPAAATSSRFSAFHIAVATKLSVDEVYAIGNREGWRAVRCTRGDNFFDVIELWVENSMMIEVLTAEMQTDYLAFSTSENFRAFAAAAAAGQAAQAAQA